MSIENVAEIIFGNDEIDTSPYRIFDEKICSFLEELSKAIRKDAGARAYSDIYTFAFWIRKVNIDSMKERLSVHSDEAVRFGRGLVFHIAPSNIPINFAYTWVFGLLSGNANIVKVSSKRFAQTEIICRIAKELIKKKPEYKFILEKNQIIIYEREREDITKQYVKHCDAKVIWGGDATVERIREYGTKPRCVEIAFADRYSFAVIDTETVMRAEEEKLRGKVRHFYNDTYLVDQNACSSPQMIFWIGKEYEEAKEKFFSMMLREKERYDLTEIIASDKYEHLCEMICTDKILNVQRYENFIYVYDVVGDDKKIAKYRGKCGEFYCTQLDTIDALANYLDDEKLQSCVVYGIDKKEVLRVIVENGIKGVDRIVEMGQALNLGIVWDGYDVLVQLSRIISYI